MPRRWGSCPAARTKQRNVGMTGHSRFHKGARRCLLLTRSRASTLAPASNSLFTSCWFPFRQAQCRAVRWSWGQRPDMRDVAVTHEPLPWPSTAANFPLSPVLHVTLSWALGSPPSTRYLSTRASWFSAAAFRNLSRSTGSSRA